MKNTCIDCLIKVFEGALERLYKLRDAAREGTLPPFTLLPEKTAVDLTTAHRTLEELWNSSLFQNEYEKMLHRNRTRRWRARKKQARETVTVCDAPVTVGDDGVTKCDADVTFGDGDVTECDGSVTFCDGTAHSGGDFAKKEKENEKRKKQRKEINKNKKIKTNIADAMPNSARARTREEEAETAEENTTGLFAETDYVEAGTQCENSTAEGSCLPFQPPEKKTQTLIPTAELPEVCRNIVGAWNKLPLPKKLSGLYPSLVKRLNFLLENYGEEQIHNAIASIAESPFLLGKSKNNRGWVVSLYWFMEPEHFEKILSGDYHDDRSSGNHCLFQPGDELQPWGDGFYGTVVY